MIVQNLAVQRGQWLSFLCGYGVCEFEYYEGNGYLQKICRSCKKTEKLRAPCSK